MPVVRASGSLGIEAIVTRILSQEDVSTAAEILRTGGLVVFPTETVYGLGADARNVGAVTAVFQAKGRPADNPLIVHVADVESIEAWADLHPVERLLFARFAPGPLTLVLSPVRGLSPRVSAGLGSVGFRIPAHPVARALLAAFKGPVAAPSANRSGRPSPTGFRAALAEMQGRVDAILDGGDCPLGLESTVARLEGSGVRILRPGAVTADMIREETGLGVVEEALDPVSAGPAPSPGLRHRHYRPAIPVLLFGPGSPDAGDLEARLPDRFGLIRVLDPQGLTVPPGLASRAAVLREVETVAEYGHELYRFFFACEAAGCGAILAELPQGPGLAVALRNRLERAAE